MTGLRAACAALVVLMLMSACGTAGTDCRIDTFEEYLDHANKKGPSTIIYEYKFRW